MRRKLGYFIFLMITMTSLIFAGTVYYIDATNGNDDSNGLSESTAWKTISKVNNYIFLPGDSILFKRGEEWREQLNVSSSGSEGSPITFGAYGGGDNPIINASTIMTNWSYNSGNIWVVTCATEPTQVFFDGTRGNKQTAIEDVDSEYVWYWTANVLYVYSESAPDTAYTNHGIEASVRNNCFYLGDMDYITIKNINCQKGKEYNIKVVYGSSNVIIDSVTLSYAYGYGIYIGWYLPGAPCNNNTVKDSSISYCGGSGIQVAEYTDTTLIQNNTVFNNCQLAIEDEQNYTAGIKANNSTCTGLIIENNTVYNEGEGNTGNRGYGIWTDTDVSSPIIRYNQVHDCAKSGIFIEITDSAQVYYNQSYNNANHGIRMRGGADGTCSGNKIYNNIFYNNSNAGLYLESDGVTADSFCNNLIRNNISDGNTQEELSCADGTENDGTIGSGNIYEYNCFGTEYAGFIWFGAGKNTYDLWKTTYGGSTYSVEADPLMTDPANADFTLQAGSPCINTGTDVGLTQDYAGNTVPYGGGVDIGAYESEYVGSSDPLYAEISASLTSGWVPLTVNFTESASGGTEPYTYAWDFGDGEYSSEQNPSRTYSTTGDFTVTLTVTDSDSNEDTDSLIISASEKTDPLRASIAASPSSGEVPLTVNFTASASGGTSPYSFSWDFGDGGSSSAQNPSHTYTNAGTYNVTLTVTDAQSGQASNSLTITAGSISTYQLAVSAATGSPAPGAGGTTDPSPGNHSYSVGNSVQVKAIPNENYRFSKWTGDVSGSEAYNEEANITMDKNKSISAYFFTKCGDVTGDLSITPADCQAAFDIFLGIISNPTESEKENADVNCSGTKTEPDITPGDAQAIFERFLGINELPCDCSCNSRNGSVLTQMILSQMKQTPDINLTINDIRVDQGGEIFVPIIVDNPFNIKAFGFDLIFPSEVLEFVGVERKEPLDDFYQKDAIKIADGVVRAGGYRSKPILSHSPRALITLIFKVIEEAKDVGSDSFSIINTTDDIKNTSYNNEKIIKRIWDPRNIPEKDVQIRQATVGGSKGTSQTS